MTNKVHPTESLGKRLMPDLQTGSGSVCANGTIVNWVTGSYNPNVLGLCDQVPDQNRSRADHRVRWVLANQRPVYRRTAGGCNDSCESRSPRMRDISSEQAAMESLDRANRLGRASRNRSGLYDKTPW